MSESVELVDLSLFAESPTNDHGFSAARVSRQDHHEAFPPSPPRQRSHTLPRDYANKPLPPLPTRRSRTRPRVSASRCCEEESRCILKRIQRIASNEQPTSQTNTLLQRRNPVSPPTLTLSVPQSRPRSRDEASAMIWMPDEQMWLITSDEPRVNTSQDTYQSAYPSPPPYYTPRAYTRSEPSPNIPPAFDLTPPLTPVQYQLQSLIQPPPRRDEERLSPLFQEAMNSVPMMEVAELFPPSLAIDTNLNSEERNSSSRLLRPQSTLERSASDVSPQSTARLSGPVRSASAGSRVSHARSDSSGSRSYYSTMSIDLTKPANSASRWADLARRVAKPESAMPSPAR